MSSMAWVLRVFISYFERKFIMATRASEEFQPLHEWLVVTEDLFVFDGVLVPAELGWVLFCIKNDETQRRRTVYLQ